MGLTWRDGVATTLVVAASGLFAADAFGSPVPGFSGTRVLSAAVLAASVGACGTGSDQTADGGWKTFAQWLGMAAFAAGVLGIVTGNALMLYVLVGVTGLLWVGTTGRHACTPTSAAPPPVADRRDDRELVGGPR